MNADHFSVDRDPHDRISPEDRRRYLDRGSIFQLLGAAALNRPARSADVFSRASATATVAATLVEALPLGDLDAASRVLQEAQDRVEQRLTDNRTECHHAGVQDIAYFLESARRRSGELPKPDSGRRAEALAEVSRAIRRRTGGQ